MPKRSSQRAQNTCTCEYFARRYQLDDDAVISETWLNKQGQLTRAFGPARLERLESGDVLLEEWWLKGCQHRADGKPAITNYDEERCGSVKSVEYWMSGELHRVDGPARISFDPTSGRIQAAEWWVRGVRINPDKMMSDNQNKMSK